MALISSADYFPKTAHTIMFYSLRLKTWIFLIRLPCLKKIKNLISNVITEESTFWLFLILTSKCFLKTSCKEMKNGTSTQFIRPESAELVPCVISH